jgi:hypothetical protein
MDQHAKSSDPEDDRSKKSGRIQSDHRTDRRTIPQLRSEFGFTGQAHVPQIISYHKLGWSKFRHPPELV